MTDLSEVRWIGGGTGAGKSTVAELLGKRFGLPVVSTDVSIRAHAARMPEVPRVRAFVRSSMDDRWVRRTPHEMLRTFPFFAGDGFDLLLDDVRADPATGPLIVEGFRLLPRLVAPLLSGSAKAVWLLPTPDMRARALDVRSADRAFWTRTSEPDRALANVLERDRLFTERVREEAQGLHLLVIEVDGAASAIEVADRLADLLGLTSSRPRCAPSRIQGGDPDRPVSGNG